MKLLINTSNLYVGGGLQVALSFLDELNQVNKEHEYHVFLSQAVNQQINYNDFSNNFKFYLIEKSPACLKTRNKIIVIMNNLENTIKPDIVFSVFGPSYWKPKAKHIMGFAVPWVLEENSIAYMKLSLLKKVRMYLWVKYVAYHAKRNTSYYVIETDDGKDKLFKALDINKNNIFVVGNSYSSIFNDSQYLSEENDNYIKLPLKDDDEYRLLLISHNHSHKNLNIINEVIPLLSEYNIKFILTINEEDYINIFSSNNKILNIGPVKQKSCPSLYNQSDAMFLPTLLEVFSASYPEAMKMEKPILTSNYSFATDVCKDAAIYFDPMNPKDIAEKIIMLVKDKNLQNKLTEKGKKRVLEFETAKSRAEKYIELCENLIKKEQNV